MSRFAVRSLPFSSLLVVLLVLGCGGSGNHSSSPTTPSSETSVTYTVTNGCSTGTEILVRFFDDDDAEVWPDPVDAYTVQAGMTASFPLAPVTPGTQTCFGAQPSPDPSGIFWGVGILDALDCTDCCNTVPASGTATYTVTLSPSATLGCEIAILPHGGARLRHRPPVVKSVPLAQPVVPPAAPHRTH